MSNALQIQRKYSAFHLKLWRFLDNLGPLSINLLVREVPVEHKYMKTRHRHRITNALSEMAKNGDIVRVGRGVYAAHARQVKKVGTYTLQETVAKYVEERGRVQFKQVVAAFPNRTEKSVRAALDRLRARGTLVKDGITWCWAGNVVRLDEHRAS
jgi:hypothetical protein